MQSFSHTRCFLCWLVWDERVSGRGLGLRPSQGSVWWGFALGGRDEMDGWMASHPVEAEPSLGLLCLLIMTDGEL